MSVFQSLLHKDSGHRSSGFSVFFRKASSADKKKVFLEVARKASADQKRIIEA